MVKTLIKYELVINRALRSALMYDTAEQQINEFISFLGRQIGSDRIYIFEDNEKTRTTSNTYEWCADGVSAEMGNLKAIPMQTIRLPFLCPPLPKRPALNPFLRACLTTSKAFRSPSLAQGRS